MCLKHMGSLCFAEAWAFTKCIPLSGGGGGGLRKLTHFLKRFEATAFCMPIIQQVWPLSPAVRLTDCMRQGGERAGKAHESFITSSILCMHTWLSSAKKGSFPFKLSLRFQRVSFLLEMWLRKNVKFCWTNSLPVWIQSHLLTTVMKH